MPPRLEASTRLGGHRFLAAHSERYFAELLRLPFWRQQSIEGGNDHNVKSADVTKPPMIAHDSGDHRRTP